MKNNLPLLLSFGIMTGFLVFGLWMAFDVQPKQMDDIYDSLVTNQTHRNSLTCENLELAIASGNQQMALNKPVKLIEELKDIAKEKECQFQRPDLWLDGYEPTNRSNQE